MPTRSNNEYQPVWEQSEWLNEQDLGELELTEHQLVEFLRSGELPDWGETEKASSPSKELEHLHNLLLQFSRPHPSSSSSPPNFYHGIADEASSSELSSLAPSSNSWSSDLSSCPPSPVLAPTVPSVTPPAQTLQPGERKRTRNHRKKGKGKEKESQHPRKGDPEKVGGGSAKEHRKRLRKTERGRRVVLRDFDLMQHVNANSQSTLFESKLRSSKLAPRDMRDWQFLPYDGSGYRILDKNHRLFIVVPGGAEKKYGKANAEAEQLCTDAERDFPGDGKNKRGLHFNISFGFWGQYSMTVFPHKNNRRGKKYLLFYERMKKDSGVETFKGVLSRAFGNNFRKQRPLANISKPFGRFNMLCINGNRTSTRAHTDQKNTALCVNASTAIGHFGSDQYWLAFHNLRLIIQLPPGVSILYPTSWLVHGNVHLSDIFSSELEISDKVFQGDSSWKKRKVAKTKERRYSLVWFNQGSVERIVLREHLEKHPALISAKSPDEYNKILEDLMFEVRTKLLKDAWPVIPLKRGSDVLYFG
ncbi:hypothetical protein T439DRAFT_383697 [Meredithblackwellia eburnea MCA 4105]